MDSIVKHEILRQIGETGVVAVIRARSPEEGIALGEALLEGGIRAVEVAMTTPGGLKVLESLAARLEDRGLLLGAGTVLDPETARSCILAGAQYVVAPNLNGDVVRCCHRHGLPCLPGVGSVTELLQALEWGVDVVKLFPGEVLGPRFIKAARGPVPHARILPTGGVSLENLEEWFRAGAFAVGMGGSLTHAGGVPRSPEEVRDTARGVTERIAVLRGGRA